MQFWLKWLGGELQELTAARDKCQALMSELERSKADNVKLYEKMRYVQDYTMDRPVPRAPKKV